MTAPDTTPLNQAAMDRPDSRERAERGLWKTQRVPVELGRFIYRFGSYANPSVWFSGAWWFEYADFRRIVRFAEESELTLGYAARRLAAVAYEWPGADVNAIERAMVVERLDAWAGPGRVIVGTERAADGTISHYHLAPPQDIKQLYIPGLQSGHGATAARSPISLLALAHVSCSEIPSGYFE